MSDGKLDTILERIDEDGDFYQSIKLLEDEAVCRLLAENSMPIDKETYLALDADKKRLWARRMTEIEKLDREIEELKRKKRVLEARYADLRMINRIMEDMADGTLVKAAAA